MDKSFILAAFGGVGIGVFTYAFLLSNWLLALGIGATYAGTIYLYAEYPISLLEQQVRFGHRRNRLAYGIGIFGMGVSLGGIAELLNSDVSAVLFLWAVGMFAFMVVTLTAYHREESQASF